VPAFDFHAALPGMLSPTLIGDQVVQVCEPRQKRLLIAAWMVKRFHHEQLPVDGMMGLIEPLNLLHFVARQHWPRSGPSSLHFRAHRLQRRAPLRGLLVPVATIFDLLQTARN
jgi:hypothetical protein